MIITIRDLQEAGVAYQQALAYCPNKSITGAAGRQKIDRPVDIYGI